MKMLNWLLKWREPKTVVGDPQVRAARLAEAERDVTEAEASMLSRPCAVAGMANCTKACVHFQAGYVNDFADVIGAQPPRCKLWR